MQRKIKRKVLMEIYQNNVHTMTQESGLYNVDLEGNPIPDPFGDVKDLPSLRSFFLLDKKGREYLSKVFNTGEPEYDAEFVIVKTNKKGISAKQLITKYEFENAAV